MLALNKSRPDQISNYKVEWLHKTELSKREGGGRAAPSCELGTEYRSEQARNELSTVISTHGMKPLTCVAVTEQASLGVGVWGLDAMLAQNLGPMIILGWGIRSPSVRFSQQ
jgi:hypothetical protein